MSEEPSFDMMKARRGVGDRRGPIAARERGSLADLVAEPAGKAVPAISALVGCTERTVFRVREFIRERLERQCCECDASDVK
jgi:hypothetical protein